MTQEKLWVSAKDVQEIVPVSIRTARAIVKETLTEMKNEGCYTFNSKTMLVPKDRILKKLGMK